MMLICYIVNIFGVCLVLSIDTEAPEGVNNLSQMNDDRLRLHFDTEINKILDKIRNAGEIPEKEESYRKNIAGNL